MDAAAARDIMNWLAKREDEMLALVERIVRINSYTANKAGTDAVGMVLIEVMQEMGFTVGVHPREDVGDNLVARNAAARDLAPGEKQLLFCGHMDTIFPDDGSFEGFRREGELAIGPGVVDMKGGLVVGIYALKALDHFGLLGDIPVTFVFNSDEETGSYQSRELIMAEAVNSAAAMVFECAGLGGETTTGRKGKTTFRLKVHGRSGHAGNLAGQGEKPSAILEMAHQTVALEALNDAERDVSVNVGLVSGGIGPNTIAPLAEAVVECRYRHAEDAERLTAAVTALAQKPHVAGTTVEVEVVPGRPPMEQTEANRGLLEFVRRAGEELDIPVSEDFRGGVSDANYIAHAGCPVIDGLGPVGAGDHSPQEYMVLKSLVQRTALAAVAAHRAWKDGTP